MQKINKLTIKSLKDWFNENQIFNFLLCRKKGDRK